MVAFILVADDATCEQDLPGNNLSKISPVLWMGIFEIVPTTSRLLLVVYTPIIYVVLAYDKIDFLLLQMEPLKTREFVMCFSFSFFFLFLVS